MIANLKYTSALLAALAAGLPLDQVGIDLAKARTELKDRRDILATAEAAVAKARAAVETAANDKSRAYFEQQAAQAEAVLPKLREKFEAAKSRAQTLANKAGAMAVRAAKWRSDSDGMMDEARRLEGAVS